jgi:hypothetical protein
VLESAGVSAIAWGGDSSVALKLLAQELEDGGAVLVRDEHGQLVRQITWVCADILYHSNGGELLRLVEQKQIFRDGYERIRDARVAISRRLDPFENGSESVMRQIREGLNIPGALRVRVLGVKEEVQSSQEYPGLPELCTTHNYSVVLNDKQFQRDGYVESQGDIDTFYVWEAVQE